jgi:hypothetical protein
LLINRHKSIIILLKELRGKIMKNNFIKRIIALSIISATLITVLPIGASAEWKNNSTGWWYTEGSSYATEWRQIDGKWYYFNTNGYMASNITIGGYYLGSDGAWVINPPAASKNVLNAEEYGNKLKEAGLAIDNVEVSTAENDTNQLLGRPNQYTSKINFDNGSIEVFANKSDAERRKEYIDSIGKKMSIFAEYSYINDAGVLLRVNKKVIPNDAKKYETEFQKIK